MALPDPGPKPDRHHEVVSLAERVDALMEQLPAQYKMALHLRYRQQLSYEEMAEVLDIPLGTVKARLHRAHKQMRNLMEQDS
jgi:RNA polymerase sigma-70 factor (ECF subfamily)